MMDYVIPKIYHNYISLKLYNANLYYDGVGVCVSMEVLARLATKIRSRSFYKDVVVFYDVGRSREAKVTHTHVHRFHLHIQYIHRCIYTMYIYGHIGHTQRHTNTRKLISKPTQSRPSLFQDCHVSIYTCRTN